MSIHKMKIDVAALPEDMSMDGIVFHVTAADDDRVIYGINFIEATEKQKVDFIDNGLGFKYHITIMNDDKTLETYDAILGDPINYVNNCMAAGDEGFIIKYSKWGSEITTKFTITHYMDMVAKALTGLKESKENGSI